MAESAEKKEPSMVEEEAAAAPYVIVVHGPPKVGKSLLIKSLIEHYTEKNHAHIQAPITLRTRGNRRRRIQFVECPNNMNGMIDAAKYADAVMLLIDANYGFEMETFEFLNLLQVHGTPKVMGVLTYLDELKDENSRTIAKQRLMRNFKAHIYQGARIFGLSGLGDNGMSYKEHEIQELADFLSSEEFHSLPCRATTQPYLLVDRFEDVTSSEEVQMDSDCKRNVILYCYLRGCDIKKGTTVHIAGVGDYPLADVTVSADPCPLPPDSNELKMQKNLESFRIGTYLAFRVLGVPFEMVTNRDPCQPILVGGISPAEQSSGYMQARLKRHSWHMNSLKSNDPIVVSVGWRRYKTIPIYTRDWDGGWHKMLEYTPEDESCFATFYGPLAPSGAGVVAVKSLADNKAPFRILATADVLGHRAAAKIMKKIKRIGTPCLISNEIALVKGMFTSDDDVDRFRYAKIKTEGGIRGVVNEAAAKSDLFSELKWNDSQPREGIAKCTFDCIIRMSDIIVMSQWFQIKVPPISIPPMAALEPINRVWQSTESEKSKEYVLAIDENKIAGEKLRKRLIGEKLKHGPVRTRGTLEQQRAVILFEPIPSDWEYVFWDDYNCGE